MSDQYYIKNGRKYIPVGYDPPKMHDGIYFHQSQKNGSRTTCLRWWVGKNPSEPIDANLLLQIMPLDEKIARYIYCIQDENSEEFKQLREDSCGSVKDPPKVYNISPHELAVSILRQVYENLKAVK